MLNISAKSFKALESAQLDRFVDGIVDTLWQEMPEECRAVGHGVVHGLVARTVARADGWLIDDSECVGQLCALALGFGEKIFDDPQLESYLATHEDDAAERVAALLHEIEAMSTS